MKCYRALNARTQVSIGLLGIALLMVIVLRAMGQGWWCKCGVLTPWTSDVVSSHNSQHVFDPYSFSHFQHGLALYLILWLTLRHRASVGQRALLMLGLEAAWEVFENTPFTIERYRAATISLDYFGDSIFNSLGDLASCVLGFLFAASAPVWLGFASYFAIELSMLFIIRDSLFLNLLMLLHPIEAIKRWQNGA